MKDLTKGKPSTLILAFALPIFFANLLQLTYSLVDTRIVGTFLGEDALAAVGATTTLSNLIIGFLQGLSGGFAIIIAQKFGAKDYKNVKKSFAMSLTMGTGIAIFFTVFGLLFLQPILNILNVPSDLMATAKSYIFVIIAGLVATFLYDACAAALRSLGDTVTPLVILAISVALNIVGDLLFVVVLKSGVRGAAIATVLAQAIAFVVCWIYMVKRYELLRLSREDFKDPNPVMVKNMLGAGMSMGFMSSLINIGSLTLQTAINKLGNDYYAYGSVINSSITPLLPSFDMSSIFFNKTDDNKYVYDGRANFLKTKTYNFSGEGLAVTSMNVIFDDDSVLFEIGFDKSTNIEEIKYTFLNESNIADSIEIKTDCSDVELSTLLEGYSKALIGLEELIGGKDNLNLIPVVGGRQSVAGLYYSDGVDGDGEETKEKYYGIEYRLIGISGLEQINLYETKLIEAGFIATKTQGTHFSGDLFTKEIQVNGNTKTLRLEVASGTTYQTLAIAIDVA